MKKNGKLITLALFTFLMGSVPAFAREMTLSELGEEASKIQKDAGYVYIIGDYAFTSKFNIKTEDIMLASSTIKPENPTDSSKMVINQITRTYNDSYEPTGWAKGTNALGTAELPTKVNVRYIDYHYIKDITKVDTDALVNSAENAVSTELFTVGEVSNGEVAVTIKEGKLKETIEKGMGSGVFPLLAGMLQNKQVQSIDFVYTSGDTEVTLTLDKSTLGTLDPETWLNENCEKIFGKKYEELILAELIGKEFTATLNLAETDETEYVTEKDGTAVAEYKVKFDGKKEEVDTDNIVKEASENTKLNDDIFTTSFDSASHTVTADVKDVSKSIYEGMGSGVIQTLIEVLSKEDVQSIDFVYTSGETKVTLTLDKDKLSELDPEAWLEENCEKIFGKKLEELYTADLIGKSFTAKVNLKSYAEKKSENPEEYTFKFTGKLKEIDTDTLVSNASSSSNLNNDMFTATYTDGKVNVTVVDVSKSIKEGMGSGVLQTLVEVFSNADVQSIDFVYTSDDTEVTLTLDKDKLSELDPEAWLEENCEKIFGKKLEELYTADLIGKSFTAKVNLKSYAEKKDGNKEEYTFSFDGTLKQVKSEELANSIKDEIDDSGVYTVEVTENNIVATAKDSETTIKEGMGSGIIQALVEVLNKDEVQSIDFVYTSGETKVTLTLDKDKLSELNPQQWLEENSQAIFGKEYSEDITNKDLNGKTFKVTVNLKSYAEFSDDSQSTTYDVTIKLDTHKVSFNYNGSTTPSTAKEVVDGSSVEEPTNPTWEGHEFNYWYVEGHEETKYNFDNKVKDDITLYAKWTLLTKTENYILEKSVSGQTVENFESEYNTESNTVNITVTKPSDDISSIALVNDVKGLLEKDEVEKVIITYNGIPREFTDVSSAEDEVIAFLEQVANNTLANISLFSTRSTGLTLKALEGKTIQVKVVIDTDVAKVDDNEELTEIIYNISFDVLTHKVTLNYEDDETEQEILTIDNHDKLTKENPTREGYRFLGWFKEGEEEPFNLQTEITEDLKLTARWIKQYSVTLNYNYSNSPETKATLMDEGSELPTLDNREENGKQYKFMGWYEDISSEDTLTTKVEKEVTLTAKWAEIVTREQLKSLGETQIPKIDNNKIYTVKVDGNNIAVYYTKENANARLGGFTGTGLKGSGVKTAMRDYLKTSETGIKSLTLCAEDKCQDVVYDDVNFEISFTDFSWLSKANDLLDKFGVVINKTLEGTGKTIDTVTNADMKGKSFTVKVNLADGKVFADDLIADDPINNNSYTYTYTVTFNEGA